MESEAIFSHAGCPVCVSAEEDLVRSLNPTRVQVEMIHLGEAKERISTIQSFGVKSVPPLVLEGQVVQINFGTTISDLK